MRILLIKMSSMGDVIHALPAITDLKRAMPGATLDWVVEERFAYIPKWHPGVDTVIPIALRRWRKNWLKSRFSDDYKTFCKRIKHTHYDVVIDAQGLLKSALVARKAHGQTYGYNRHSIREPLASMLYRHTIPVSRELHAVTRVRQLFSQAFDYSLGNEQPDFGLDRARFSQVSVAPTIVLCHGTTWDNKHWPEVYWKKLVQMLVDTGYQVKLAWGNVVEKDRSLRLSHGIDGAQVLPDLNIEEMAEVIAGAAGVVAVDTGFAHLAQAFDVPLVVLFGPTSAELTGPIGQRQKALSANFPCAPCFKRQCYYQGKSKVAPACFENLTPERVIEAILG